MIQQKFVIKDGVLLRIREERIVDRSKLLKYNPNLRVLADDIRRSRKDEHFVRQADQGTLTHFWLILQMLFIPFINKLNMRAKIRNLYHNCK